MNNMKAANAMYAQGASLRSIQRRVGISKRRFKKQFKGLKLVDTNQPYGWAKWWWDSEEWIPHPGKSKFRRFDELIAEMEADPKLAAALEEGRKWVRETFYNE